jgi:hypothetical protein
MKIEVKYIIMPKTTYSKAGQTVEVFGENIKTGVVYSQVKPTGKLYTVSISIQVDSETGVPYAAKLVADKGGNSTTIKDLQDINLSKLSFILTDGSVVKVSNTGRIRGTINPITLN